MMPGAGIWKDDMPKRCLFFMQSTSIHPTTTALNQWIGVSLLETGRVAEAEKYLTFASQKKIPEASLYLGELYPKMYRFDEAEKEFGKYQNGQPQER